MPQPSKSPAPAALAALRPCYMGIDGSIWDEPCLTPREEHPNTPRVEPPNAPIAPPAAIVIGSSSDGGLQSDENAWKSECSSEVAPNLGPTLTRGDSHVTSSSSRNTNLSGKRRPSLFSRISTSGSRISQAVDKRKSWRDVDLDMDPDTSNPSARMDSQDSLHESNVSTSMTLVATSIDSMDVSVAGANSVMASDEAADRLKLAKRSGRLRLLRLRVPTIAISICMLFGGFYIWKTSVTYTVTSIFATIAIGWAGLAYSTALLPTDHRLVKRSMVLVAIPFLLMLGAANILSFVFQWLAESDECNYGEHADKVPCWHFKLFAIMEGVDAIGFLGIPQYIGVLLYRRTPTEQLLSQWWLCLGTLMVVMGFTGGLRLIAPLSVGGLYKLLVLLIIRVCCFFTAGILALQASKHSGGSCIQRLQSWLMTQGESAAAAAGVSELLGGRNPGAVLEAGRRRFLYVTADKLRVEDMAENKPNPALAKYTQHGHLGHVDAFVSHSWHDDAEQKWECLQEWRQEFKMKHRGREPKLWIDKYCIDQDNIEESLACLPVFLAGCRNLVILCGSTYLERLWCWIEIFVFIEMGGQKDNLVIKLFDQSDPTTNSTGFQPHGSKASKGSSSDTLGSIRSSRNSNALGFAMIKNARCATEYDTERLQCVIATTGYGRITKPIREVFAERSVKIDIR